MWVPTRNSRARWQWKCQWLTRLYWLVSAQRSWSTSSQSSGCFILAKINYFIQKWRVEEEKKLTRLWQHIPLRCSKLLCSNSCPTRIDSCSSFDLSSTAFRGLSSPTRTSSQACSIVMPSRLLANKRIELQLSMPPLMLNIVSFLFSFSFFQFDSFYYSSPSFPNFEKWSQKFWIFNYFAQTKILHWSQNINIF